MIFTSRANYTQTLISVGLLIFFVFLSIYLVLSPIFGATIEKYENVVGERERLTSLRTKRVNLLALEAALAEQRSKGNDRPSVLDAASSAAAWEQLESIVKTAISTQGGSVTSVRGLPLDNEAGYHAVRLELIAQASRDQIQNIIQGIETSAPVIFFEKINLSAVRPMGDTDQDVINMTATLRALAVISVPKAQRR